MRPLDPDTRRRLVRCLGMLGSDFEGERAAAGLLASRLVKSAGATWDEVVPPSLPPPRPARDAGQEEGAPMPWRVLARTCWFYRDELTEWERGFISGLPRFRRISEKQRVVLERIVGKLRDMGCAV